MTSNLLCPTNPGLRYRLANVAKQLMLKDELALLVLLRVLIRLVILPPDNLFALSTLDVADNMTAGRHVAFARLASLDVDDHVK